jgi:hypothetical protein
MASNDGVTVNNELRGMWKEAVMAFLKVPFRHLPGGLQRIGETSVTTVGVPVEI